jgi:hypothetical protein
MTTQAEYMMYRPKLSSEYSLVRSVRWATREGKREEEGWKFKFWGQWVKLKAVTGHAPWIPCLCYWTRPNAEALCLQRPRLTTWTVLEFCSSPPPSGHPQPAGNKAVSYNTLALIRIIDLNLKTSRTYNRLPVCHPAVDSRVITLLTWPLQAVCCCYYILIAFDKRPCVGKLGWSFYVTTIRQSTI